MLGSNMFMILMRKWYYTITAAALTVTILIFSGLSDLGFVEFATKKLEYTAYMTKTVAQKCIPKISKGFKDFISCVNKIESEKKYCRNNKSSSASSMQNISSSPKKLPNNDVEDDDQHSKHPYCS